MSRRGTLKVALVTLVGLLAAGPAARAQTVEELLEKGIYTEETVGDLDAAIEIYDRIVKQVEADRRVVAQALVRTATCHLRMDRAERALVVLKKLVDDYPDQKDLVRDQVIEMLKKMLEDFPDEADLVDRFREILEGKAKALPIGPAPWVDGELLRFGMSTHSGKKIGDITFSVMSETVDDQDVWRVESRFGVPGHGGFKFCRVDADRESFRPINGILHHFQLGRLEARYTEDERQIRMNRPGGEAEPYTQKLTGVVYDNEQAIHLVRRLPLAEGYKAHIPLTGRPGTVGTASLYVIGKDSITVPAGTFECYKVQLGIPGKGEIHYYSADEHKYLVAVRNSDVDIDLAEIARMSDEAVIYEDARAGISMSAPAGWDILKSASGDTSLDTVIQIFAPEMKAWGVFYGKKAARGTTSPDARRSAEKAVADKRRKHKSFTVRKESLRDRKISGLPAASVASDFVHHGWNLVDYRIYVASESNLYWFVFWMQRDDFEATQGDIDTVVASLNLGKTE